MDINLSERTVQLLKAFIPGVTSKQAAESTGIPIQVVTGSLASMKKRQLVDVTNGVISLTEEGEKAIGLQKVVEVTEVKVHVADPNSKKAKATPIIVANISKVKSGEMKRGSLLKLMMDEAGLTYHGANTYLYNWEKANKKAQEKSA